MDTQVAGLQAELDQARAQLSQQANPYRTGNRDFYVAVSGKPIRETLDTFNGLPAGDRTLTMSELSAGGHVAEIWTDCFWPLSGRIGLFIAPVPWRYAMGAIVHIGKLHYSGWNPSQGVQYRLQGTPAGAYAAFYGGIEFCGIEAPIAPIVVVLAGGTFDALSGAKLIPRPGQGIDYEFQMEDPLVFAGILYIGGVITLPIAFPLKPQLFKGSLPNMLGKEGEVQVHQNGQLRKYTLDLSFTQANFIDQGLAASGTIGITWK
jgi:hypothetical protein